MVERNRKLIQLIKIKPWVMAAYVLAKNSTHQNIHVRAL